MERLLKRLFGDGVDTIRQHGTFLSRKHTGRGRAGKPGRHLAERGTQGTTQAEVTVAHSARRRGNANDVFPETLRQVEKIGKKELPHQRLCGSLRRKPAHLSVADWVNSRESKRQSQPSKSTSATERLFRLSRLSEYLLLRADQYTSKSHGNSAVRQEPAANRGPRKAKSPTPEASSGRPRGRR